MKEQFMPDTELYDHSQHGHNDSGIMEDMSSYRPGDSVADTVIAPSSLPDTRFIEKFRFWSILGFTSTMMCTWELVLATSYFPLVDGGVSGLVWCYITTAIAISFVIASIAEIASMAPSCGNLYHWVGEFAPKEVQKYLSYLVGWMSVVGWLSGTAILNFMAGTMMQSLAKIWHTEYSHHSWHGSLIVIGVGILCTFLNTVAVKRLPLLELITLFVHFLGIFVVLFPLWILAPKASVKQVFRTFEDNGDWGNVGIACLVAQIGPLFSLLRSDSGTHLSEKIPRASRLIPCSMIATAFVNGLMGFAMIITFAFSIHNLQPILSANDSDTYPFIVLYYLATGSKGLTTATTIIIIFLILGASVSAQATAARHVFAFARDEGLPFPFLWSKVSHIGGKELPLNAFWLSLAVTVMVALVHLGLSSVFQFIIALFVSSILTGCFLAVACALTARLSGVNLPQRMWTLGHFSTPVNIISLGYIGFAFVMSFFPLTASELRPSSMNWASLVWIVVFGFSTILYVVHGRYVFKAPIMVFGRSCEDLPPS